MDKELPQRSSRTELKYQLRSLFDFIKNLTKNETGSMRRLREKAINAFVREGFEKESKAWEAFNIWMEQEEAMVRKAKDFHQAQLRLSMKTALFYEKIGYIEAAINAYNNAWNHAYQMGRHALCLFCEGKLRMYGSEPTLLYDTIITRGFLLEDLDTPTARLITRRLQYPKK